jgi:hypothetical protein
MILGTGEEYPEGRGHIGDEYIQYHRGHSRDRRDRNRRDYTPFHTQADTKPKIEDKEHINLDTKAKIEGTIGDRRETPEGRGKGLETHIDSTQTMFNDLARGQRALLNTIQQMNISAQMPHHSMSTIGTNVARGPCGSGGHQGGGASGSNVSQGGASPNPSPVRAYTSSRRIP